MPFAQNRGAVLLVLLALPLSTAIAVPWPSDMQAPRTLSYSDLDRISYSAADMSFHDYLTEIEALRSWFPSEAHARTWLDENVSEIRFSDHHAELALYTAYAEETSFRERIDGTGLKIDSFGGMNVAHRLVAEMLEQMLAGASVSPAGDLRGVARLIVDTGAQNNDKLIEIDFDNGTIVPELHVIGSMGQSTRVTTDDVAAFVRTFHRRTEHDLNGMSIFVRVPDVAILRHEIMHALFTIERGYRAEIRDYARELTSSEREQAVLFAAINYDAFDPDMTRRNPDIVLDEVLNAYRREGLFEPVSDRSRLSIGDFLRAYPMDLSLATWASIDELPFPQDTRRSLRELYAYLDSQGQPLTEAEFLERWRERVFDNVYCLSCLRSLLIAQQPQFYARVLTARRLLVDERLDTVD